MDLSALKKGHINLRLSIGAIIFGDKNRILKILIPKPLIPN